MTLDERIAAFQELTTERITTRHERDSAAEELAAAIVAHAAPVLPFLCLVSIEAPSGDWQISASGELTGCPDPLEIAAVLANLLDRQLRGNLPHRVEEMRVQAAVMRALAGALDGLASARRAKKTGGGR